jgi:hypothetical protein
MAWSSIFFPLGGQLLIGAVRRKPGWVREML